MFLSVLCGSYLALVVVGVDFALANLSRLPWIANCYLLIADFQTGKCSENCVPCCGWCNKVKGHLETAGFRYPRTIELLRERIAERLDERLGESGLSGNRNSLNRCLSGRLEQ